MNRRHYLWMPALLIVMVIALALATLIRPKADFSPMENRQLKKKISISKEAILSRRTMEDFEQFIADHFLFRNYWVDLKVKVDYLMGQRISEDVYRGQDGYLIQHFSLPDQDVLDQAVHDLEDFSEALPDWKKTMILIPTGAHVLEDKLPSYAPVGDEAGLLKFLDQALGHHYHQVKIFDLMKTKSREEALYYKTDHHWNAQGAFVAASAFLRDRDLLPSSLEEWSRRESPEPFYGSLYSRSGYYNNEADLMEVYYKDDLEDDLVVDYHGDTDLEGIYDWDAFHKKDQYTVFFGGNYGQVDIENPNGIIEQPLVILKDSYANAFIPYILPYYKHVRMLDLRFIRGEVMDYLPENGEILLIYNGISFGDVPFKKLGRNK